MRTGQTTPDTRSRRLAAAWCLAAMLGSLTWLWPLAVFLVAVLDGSHRSAIRAQATGMAVVLQHEERDAQPVRGHDRAFGHQHCLAATALAFLADDATSQVDHVIQFGGGSTQFAESQSVRPAPPTFAAAIPVFSAIAVLAALPERTPALQPRPPPVPSALLLQVRSTVLLV